MIGGLVAGSAWGLWRAAWWGFLAAAFFLVLAPTSTVLPLADPAFEHRMYLPLAPLLVGVVMAVRPGLARVDPSGRAGLALLAAVALALGFMTSRRNVVYQSPIALWQSVVAVAPENARAHHNLGLRWLENGAIADAEPPLREAQRLAPQWADPMASLGYLLAGRGEFESARQWYERSVAADPRVASARIAYAFVLAELAKPRAAVVQYRAGLALTPERGDVHLALGLALYGLGHSAQALEALDAAQRLGVEAVAADLVRSETLLRSERAAEGFEVLRTGLRREPNSIALANSLAWHLATHSNRALRDADEAVRLARLASEWSERREPNVLDTLAAALAAAGRSDEARSVIDEALALATSRGAKGDGELIRSLRQRRSGLASSLNGSRP